MIKLMIKNWKIISIIFLLLSASCLPAVNALSENILNTKTVNESINPKADGLEYWGLLIAVGVYADNPEEDRPLMLEEVDDFYDLLVESSWWSEDHIKVIKGEELNAGE